MTLLEEALKLKRTKSGTTYTAEDMELAQAWAHNEIGTNQVQKALKHKNSSQTYAWLAHALGQAIRNK